MGLTIAGYRRRRPLRAGIAPVGTPPSGAARGAGHLQSRRPARPSARRLDAPPLQPPRAGTSQPSAAPETRRGAPSPDALARRAAPRARIAPAGGLPTGAPQPSAPPTAAPAPGSAAVGEPWRTTPLPGGPPADPSRSGAPPRRRANSASRRRRHSVRQASRRGGGPCCASISDAAAAAPQPARSQSSPAATAASSAPPNALPAPVASTAAAGQVGMYRYSVGGRASSAPCAPSRSATPPTPVVSRRAAISRASASRGSGAIPSGVRLSGAGRVGGGPPGGVRIPSGARTSCCVRASPRLTAVPVHSVPDRASWGRTCATRNQPSTPSIPPNPRPCSSTATRAWTTRWR